MATYQTTFNETFAVGAIGMIANTEPSNKISRTNTSVMNFGIPVYGGSANHQAIPGTTFAATGAGSAASGNVGTGTITASPTITTGAKKGRYTIVLTGTSSTAPYIVYDPDGLVAGHGNVASANTSITGITTFTISNAGTMTAGDTYYIDVTYTANVDFLGISVRDPSVPALESAPDQYPANYTCSIMDFGVMWVDIAGAAVKRQQAYWNPSTGKWTPSTGIPILGAEFYESATDTLCRVKLRRVTGA